MHGRSAKSHGINLRVRPIITSVQARENYSRSNINIYSENVLDTAHPPLHHSSCRVPCININLTQPVSVFIAVVAVAVLARGGRGVDVDLRAVCDRVEQALVAVGGLG